MISKVENFLHNNATSQEVKHHTCMHILKFINFANPFPPRPPPPQVIDTQHTRSKETLNRILSNHESPLLRNKVIESNY